MIPVTVRGIAIGTGRPKVIVPIVARTEDDLLAKATAFAALDCACIEWRADWLPESVAPAVLHRCLAGLRTALGEKLLLVTFRTKTEGGEQALAALEYEAFCRCVCESGCADLLDVELSCGEGVFASSREAVQAAGLFERITTDAHRAGVVVVASSHDFEKTPPAEAMVSRLCEMQRRGGDIAKLAVMPHRRTDVLELLAATEEMTRLHPDIPVISMSMGALGVPSRICGEAFGSAMTFAAADTASAPGQLALDALNAALDALHV